MNGLVSSRRAFLGTTGAVGVAAAAPAAAQAARAPLDPMMAMPARTLAGMIAGRKVSCEEVMRAALAQIAGHNERFNAIVALQDGDALLAQARAMDAQLAGGAVPGPLFGLPWAVKDLQAVKGIRSTSGSLALKDNVPTSEGIMVRRLRAAGALFVGKSNAPEFGLGSHTINKVYGPTRGAYDPARSAGGSTGGGAVALALRMLPLADGSDFGGSLRNPAAWNNVFGFRPGIGVVPSDGAEQWVSRMSVSGPMARTVEDMGLLLSVQAGRHPLSVQSLDVDTSAFLGPLGAETRGVRIGWLGDWGGRVPHDPALMTVCRDALGYFAAMGCTVDEARLDFEAEPVWQALVTLRSWVTGASLRGYIDNPSTGSLIGPQTRWEVENSRAISGTQVLAASTVRTGFTHAFEQLFDRFDFLVAPATQIFAFPMEQLWPTEINGQAMRTYHEWQLANFLVTLTGLPAISVPAGFAGGLPAGLQIVGRRGGDLDCLKIGHGYEQAAARVINRLPPALA